MGGDTVSLASRICGGSHGVSADSSSLMYNVLSSLPLGNRERRELRGTKPLQHSDSRDQGLSSASTWPPLHPTSPPYFLWMHAVWVISYVGPLEQSLVTWSLVFLYFVHIFWNDGPSFLYCYNKWFFFFFLTTVGGEWDALWSNKKHQLTNATPCFFGESERGDFHLKFWPAVKYDSKLVRYFIADWKTLILCW